MYKKLFIIILFVYLLLGCLGADASEITIDASIERGQINPLVFGNNLIAYDPSTYENWTKEFYGYSDYGAGIWDPKWETTVQEVINLAKTAGVTALRFPGGCGAHHYDWKKAVGPNREHFLFGIDEFLKVTKEIGVEPVITLSYFTGDAQDKADLVEYLNAIDDGEHRWATLRAQNGHKEPYGVKYFEVGNEDWHGDHRNIKRVVPEEYASRYLKYYFAMKSVDPSIKIGVILQTPEWNRIVIEAIKDKIDFGIIHIYSYPEADKETLERMVPKDIFSISLAVPTISDEYRLSEAANNLKEKTEKNVPLFITEYNGGFVQEKPVPYRHCLGTALINAELLKIFMNPDNNVLMANYWNLNNSYTGMIANGFTNKYKDLNLQYYKRPNYYIFDLYKNHFGKILLKCEVKSSSYDLQNFPYFKDEMWKNSAGEKGETDYLVSTKWKIKTQVGVNCYEKNRILNIEFIEPIQGNYFHAVKTTNVQANTFYLLEGMIKTEDLNDEEGVCLEVQDIRGWTVTNFAEQTERIRGTTDWSNVKRVFKTSPDMEAIQVIARRNSNALPLQGKAYFKNVTFQRFKPITKVPFLSVNASKSIDEAKIYLIVINRNMNESMTATIDLRNFIPAVKGNAWVLNGPSVDATNEKKHDNVKVLHHEFEIKGNPLEFTFEPHSLTAIEIERFVK